MTEHCDGRDLLAVLGTAERLPDDKLQAALLETFSKMAVSRCTHGDLKGTNLLWDGSRLSLIDLDSLQVHSSEKRYAKAWMHDRKRFIRNWPEGSVLASWLDANLPASAPTADSSKSHQ